MNLPMNYDNTWIHYHGGDFQVRIWLDYINEIVYIEVQDLATISGEWSGPLDEFFIQGFDFMVSKLVWPHEIKSIREEAISKLLGKGFSFNPKKEAVLKLLEDGLSFNIKSNSYNSFRSNQDILHDPIDGVIFLCHSSNYKPYVEELYLKLKGDGFNPWLDKKDLLGGQDWEFEIRRTIRKAKVIIICLTKDLKRKTGYVQSEIKMAMNEATKYPDGSIFIIPVRLEECDVPDRLQSLHRIDLFEEDGYQKLKNSLKSNL